MVSGGYGCCGLCVLQKEPDHDQRGRVAEGREEGAA